MGVLVYVRPYCKNTDGTFEYDFFFSDTPEYVWGQSWDVDNPSINGNLTPDSTTYSEIYRVKTDMPLKTAEETSCYSMEYATYGMLPLCWIDIENLATYPTEGRIPMYFNEEKESVIEKLSLYDWKLGDKNLY